MCTRASLCPDMVGLSKAARLAQLRWEKKVPMVIMMIAMIIMTVMMIILKIMMKNYPKHDMAGLSKAARLAQLR